MEELVKSVLLWWKEHECDTTGDYGDYNIYNETPEFVRLAQGYAKENNITVKE
jgi:hypothetical protein